MPDRLKWRRGEAGKQGALLFLRCHEGHRLALAHDHQRIGEAINRYFGYVLVDAVKLSAEPFTDGSDKTMQTAPEPSARAHQKVDAVLASVEDNELKGALHKLGLGVLKDKQT